jgi:hypothetical protein
MVKKTEPRAKVRLSTFEPTRTAHPGTAPSAKRTEPIAKKRDSSLAFSNRVNRSFTVWPARSRSILRAPPDSDEDDAPKEPGNAEEDREYPEISHRREDRAIDRGRLT